MTDPLLFLQAFAAGMLGFFAPCTVAMLPAYLGFYLGRDAVGDPTRSERPRMRSRSILALPGAALVAYGAFAVLQRQSGLSEFTGIDAAAIAAGAVLVVVGLLALAPISVRGALRLGFVTTIGILAVYVGIGIPITVARGIVSFAELGSAVLLVAILLVAYGALTLAGREPSFPLSIRAPGRRNLASFALFGAAYGVVSLGCNVGIFAPVLLTPILFGDAAGSLIAFAAYGGGMSVVMVLATVGAATSKGITRERIARVVPYVKPATGVVLIASGLAIAWYWWTVLRLTLL